MMVVKTLRIKRKTERKQTDMLLIQDHRRGNMLRKHHTGSIGTRLALSSSGMSSTAQSRYATRDSRGTCASAARSWCASHVCLCLPSKYPISRWLVVIRLELLWETTTCVRRASPLSWFPPRSRYICEG